MSDSEYRVGDTRSGIAAEICCAMLEVSLATPITSAAAVIDDHEQFDCPALMTALGGADWWTPPFLRRREEIDANEETRGLESVG